MANFVTPRVFVLPALLLGSVSLAACSAQGHSQNSRYASADCNVVMAQHCAGYGANHGAYSGQSAANSRYGSTQSAVSYEQYAYQPQPMMLRPAPMPAPMTYQQPSHQTSSYNVELFQPTASYSAGVADCPAGTTAQADGTCLQGSSYSYSSAAVSAPSYYPVTSSYSSGYVTDATTANCPAGTSAQSDGTCLEGASSSLSYSSPSYNDSSSTIAPPIGSYDFSDYNWGSKDTTWGSADYVSPGTRIVDNPHTYPTASEPSYSWLPTRK